MVRKRRILPLLSTLLLWGCSSKEPAAPKKSVSELDAEITKIQNEPGMPPQAKTSILNNLQRERDAADKGSAAGK